MPTRLLEKLMKPADVVLYNLQTSAAQAMINLPLAFSSQELICKFFIKVGVLGNCAINCPFVGEEVKDNGKTLPVEFWITCNMG